MAKIKVLALGKASQKFVKEAEQEYLKRLPNMVEVEEIPSPTISGGQALKKEEGRALLSKIKDNDLFVALTENGKEYSSLEFAALLERLLSTSSKKIVFGIGGAYGWDESIYERADLKISLSRLTFPHQFVRIILLEQIYRAHCINSGSSYHK